MKPATLAERFWPKVIKSDGCWTWQANRLKSGYGKIRYEKRDRLAHRTAWELTNGEIPDGLHVCHKCDNPSCVRPCHLFLGTRSDNMRDCAAKGRLNVRDMTGELNPRVKLTPDYVRAIRRDTRPDIAIAKQYGVSPAAVWLIRQRRNWKHIE